MANDKKITVDQLQDFAQRADDRFIDTEELEERLGGVDPAGAVTSVNGQTGDVIISIESLVNSVQKEVEYGTATLESSGDNASITFDVVGEPTTFSCSLVESVTPTTTANIINVIYDGTGVFGVYFNNTTTAYATTYSYSYANGKLTVSSSDSSKGYFGSGLSYKLFYTYGAVPVIQQASTVPASGQTSGSFAISGQPKAFICQMISDVELAQWHRTSYVIYDGVNTYGVEFHNSIVYSNTSWTWTHSNGTLTIRSTSTDVGGYFHNPGDYRLLAFVDGASAVEDISDKFLRGDGVWAEAGKVSSVNGKIGDVVLNSSDVGAAAASHNQSASTISAGTFAGQVIANSSGQTPGTSLLRNSKLVSTETTPTVNGEICWMYE